MTAGSSREAYFAAHVLPFLGRYCTSCHGAEKQKGELRLDQFRDLEKALANREVWGKVAEKLREGEMPPKKASQPPDSERGSMLSWIDTAV